MQILEQFRKGIWTAANLGICGDAKVNLHKQKRAAIFSFYLDFIL